MIQGEKMRMKNNVEKRTAFSILFMDLSSSLFVPSPSLLPEEERDGLRGN
jgi:hypothetical protein